MNFRYQVHQYLRSQYIDIPEVIAGFQSLDDALLFVRKREEDSRRVEGYLTVVDMQKLDRNI